MSDLELLRAYIRDQSQVAFSQLVERHINLVFSAARRHVRDSHLAEDIAQQVFILLAAKASRLGGDTIISAWLYRTTHHIAADSLRREVRRLKREQMAAETMDFSGPQGSWSIAEIYLERAMGKLKASDQAALVLRYFENKSLDEVGAALNVSADAAQKRVARALERLRQKLLVEGVSISSTTLGSAVSAGAECQAPPGLATSVSASVLANSTLLRSGLLAVSSSPFHIMTTAQVKLTAAGVVLAALLVTCLTLYRQNETLRRDIDRMRVYSDSAASEATEPAPKLSAAGDNELWRSRLEHLELLGLRGRITQLAAELRRATNTSVEARSDLVSPHGGGTDSILFSAALTNLVSTGHTLVTGGWSKEGMRGYLLATTVSEPVSEGSTRKVTVRSQIVGAPESFWKSIGWETARSDSRRSSIAAVLTPEQVDLLLAALNHIEDGGLSNGSSVTGNDGELMQFSWVMDDASGGGVLMGIDLYPRLTADFQAIEMELSPSKTPSGSDIHSVLRNSKDGLPPDGN